jgi:glutamyl-Q tRNA(Asp) synthetase
MMPKRAPQTPAGGAPVTRFAPSPTGWLHLGHVHAALFAWRTAREAGGRFLLRIEDIDAARCRPDYADGIVDDLAWLGLDWDGPVRRQSEHLADYEAALDRLAALGVLYPCFCSRKDIQAEIAHAGQAPHGIEGPPYPGTCRTLPESERVRRRAESRATAIRLDIHRAAGLTGPLAWTDLGRGTVPVDARASGDVVLARKDAAASYHLAVTIDDDLQGITLVTRGEDLVPATNVHRLLQALLGLAEPRYHHHSLLVDTEGARLSKRDSSASLRELRAAGVTPAEARRRADFPDR